MSLFRLDLFFDVVVKVAIGLVAEAVVVVGVENLCSRFWFLFGEFGFGLEPSTVCHPNGLVIFICLL